MSRGFALYVDILAALQRRPRTANHLHDALGAPVTICKLRRMLRRLLDAGVLRVSGWRTQYATNSHRERVYGVADGRPSVPHPLGLADHPTRPMAHVTKFAAIWHELAGPCSAAEIAEACETSICIARKVVRRMVETGLLGLSYRIEGSQRTALYERGAEVESRPPRQSVQERSARKKATRSFRAARPAPASSAEASR